MLLKIAEEHSQAEGLLPPSQRDGSGIGVNYADAYVGALNAELEDDRAIRCKRKGLKILLEIGEAKGEGLLRRLEHGPDPRVILRRALEEAAEAAGYSLVFKEGAIFVAPLTGTE